MSNWLRANRNALWPLLALGLILFIDRLVSPTFFRITVVDGHYFGSVIDIVKNAAPAMLLAIGMALVIATRGIDLSVGAVIAIGGAVAAVLVRTTSLPVPVIILLAIGAGTLCGMWNGFLVAFFDIQPVVATLILMVAGRGIAQLITEGQIATFVNEELAHWGTGYLFGLPFQIFIAFGVLLLIWLLTRRTAIGMLIESVGANDRASYYVGINARLIKLLVYMISGMCAGIAGIIVAANIKGADGNNAGLWSELDAVLAVVIGGASLNGGRFHLVMAMIGVLIIQSMNTGILVSGITPEFNLVVKAIVVLIVLLIESAQFRELISRPFRRTA
ncbi:MAG: ABC transporter permease [Anaerolineae bacterium]|nr:ABC transporter permease [Anaerolineae bacterium]